MFAVRLAAMFVCQTISRALLLWGCQAASLKRADHDIADLEPLLETIMVEDFHTQAEDGSPTQVSPGVADSCASCQVLANCHNYRST